MLERPILKPNLAIEVLDDERAVLLCEDETILLAGAIYAALAPLLDGRRTAHEIVETLMHNAQPEDVINGLDVLERRGYLTEADLPLPHEQAGFWESSGLSAATVAGRLRDSVVAIISYETSSGTLLEEMLHLLGIQVSDDGWFRIVLTDGYLNADLEKLNGEALASGAPWMLAKPAGRRVWLGPVFVPGHTACWACLAHRLRENRTVTTSTPPPVVALPTTSTAALALAATQVAKWLAAGRSEVLEGKLWTLETATLALRTHVVTRRPQCPSCGGKVETSLPDLRLTDEETLAMLERHVSPVTGIVPELRRCSSSPVYVYAAWQNVALPAPGMLYARVRRPYAVAGRGSTDAEARLACLAEAVERYSAGFQGGEPSIRARLRDIAPQAVDPRLLVQFSPRQYREREAWNPVHIGMHWVPHPFDQDAEIDWTPACSLSGGNIRYLPTAYCYLHYPPSDEQVFFRADSNGCAAGASIEEAQLRGLLELIERDALALWWYNRVPRPALDLASFDTPLLSRIRRHLRDAGRGLHVLEITSDIPIPVFVAVSAAKGGSHVLFGMGAHLDARTAVSHALSELCQVLAGFNVPGRLNPEAAWWFEHATLDNQPYLSPAGSPTRERDYPHSVVDDPHEALRTVLDHLARCGLEALALDLTRPDLRFPAVRVVVPGLRHHWARFGPGRLYDVPARLGWVERPLQEHELNPASFFL